MIRKTTVIVASGDADTQWRRIRKSAEPRAEYPAERAIALRRICVKAVPICLQN